MQMPRLVLLALLIAVLPAAPASAQRYRSPDPLSQSVNRARRPVPTVPAPVITERVVPERRVRDPHSGQEVVIPSHVERHISGQAVQAPPLTGYGAGGGPPVHVPGGVRPPADARQSP
jgi:hypothetical protein